MMPPDAMATQYVRLWVRNDHETYLYLIGIGEDANDVAEFGLAIKRQFIANAPEDMNGVNRDVYGDLLMTSLRLVDWFRIAEELWEDIEKVEVVL
jgi:hypothetical protein